MWGTKNQLKQWKPWKEACANHHKSWKGMKRHFHKASKPIRKALEKHQQLTTESATTLSIFRRAAANAATNPCHQPFFQWYHKVLSVVDAFLMLFWLVWCFVKMHFHAFSWFLMICACLFWRFFKKVIKSKGNQK